MLNTAAPCELSYTSALEVVQLQHAASLHNDGEVEEEEGEASCASNYSLAAQTPLNDLEDDMVWSVVQAIQLADNINASQQQFVDMLQFGQESYKKGLLISNSTRILPEEVNSVWPNNWHGAMKVITDAGYEPPIKLNVCLRDTHPCNWDVMREQEKCKHCGESGNIPYYYLSLSEKVIAGCIHNDKSLLITELNLFKLVHYYYLIC